jgi:hypothetical protein
LRAIFERGRAVGRERVYSTGMAEDAGWSRADVARWFVHRDEVDEAARALEPGDELVLGDSDARNLAAALARRGLSAQRDGGRLLVMRSETIDAPASARKPPQRATPAIAPAAAKKKIA